MKKETINICVGGPGGSSYISGYEGCNSVRLNENNEIKNTDDCHHPSNYVFYNSIMKSGIEEQHSDSGQIKITFLFPIFTQNSSQIHLNLPLISIFIVVAKH